MTAEREAGEGAAARSPLLGKVLVACTEDWFTLSHFQPLLRRLVTLAHEVVVVTRSSGRMGEIEALGARTIDLEYNRSSMNPVREARTVRALARILAAESPDVVHLIAMKPIVLGGLATALAKPRHAVVHMTGLGFLAISDTPKARIAREVALGIMRGVMRRSGSWLLVENPEDLAFLEAGGVHPDGRVTMLGGAGIDPQVFASQKPGENAVPVAAYVARMIRPKGVDVLMQAAEILEMRGVPLVVELHGDTDDGNPEAIPSDTIRAWANGTSRRYLGFTRDVASVWRRADIFVLPARSREGMPRALLEAASSGRAAIVTDVPGCRHFVRDGIEGLIVPPGDAAALAEALSRLALDQDLRARLGAAARAKILSGYTETQVQDAVEGAYRLMIGSRRP
ncbi:MAG: glycosyltransferase family 4 protein [Proteobacteria bacterium]|nr:glycosyltransferase family 4 protein [Pseudomonadota bacterium]